MSSPPRTPTSHRRQRSSISSLNGTGAYQHSRHSSYAGSYSPVTPRSSHGFSNRNSLANSQLEFSPGGGGGGGGFDGGNLADELAEAWDSEGEAEDALSILTNGDDADGLDGARRSLDSHTAMSPGHDRPRDGMGTPRRQESRRRNQHQSYDGSEYGDRNGDDLAAAEGVSAGLEARMAAVEGLARRGVDPTGSDKADKVVERVTEALRDLGSQAGIETGATRLSTAHSALSTHLAHQTRTLTSLTSSVLSPFSFHHPAALALDAAAIDALIPLLDATAAALPHPAPAPLLALHGLAAATRDLASDLAALADSLHVGRQVSATAARRLRTVREALAEWRREADARDEGVRWIERGGWEQRLSGRECAGVCRDVVGGFEEVCEGWRERLMAGREAEVGAVG